MLQVQSHSLRAFGFLAILGLVVSMFCTTLYAKKAATSKMEYSEFFAYETPSGANISMVGGILTNPTKKAITLKSANAPIAQVELHDTTNAQGHMEMHHIPEIAIKANDKVVLQSGGLHIMLINLESPLKAGDTLEITLHFSDGDLLLQVPVIKKEVSAK